MALVGVKGGLLAIDAEGVVLPSADFTAESASLYPRIAGVESSPQGPEGSARGDPVVEKAAALVLAVGPEWKQIGLTECRPTRRPGVRRWELVGRHRGRSCLGRRRAVRLRASLWQQRRSPGSGRSKPILRRPKRTVRLISRRRRSTPPRHRSRRFRHRDSTSFSYGTAHASVRHDSQKSGFIPAAR
jgi:hypothetical protein